LVFGICVVSVGSVCLSRIEGNGIGGRDLNECLKFLRLALTLEFELL
jgi:hypothetical protein